MKKLITLAVVAFLLFYVVSQPQGSAGVVHRLFAALGNAAHAVATFLQSLFV